MSDDISSKVKKIVADHLGIDEAKVAEELVNQTLKARVTMLSQPFSQM